MLQGAEAEAFDLDADVFHDAAHRTVIETIMLLAERRGIVAQASVVDRLRATQQYDAVGGDALFSDAVNSIATTGRNSHKPPNSSLSSRSRFKTPARITIDQGVSQHKCLA